MFSLGFLLRRPLGSQLMPMPQRQTYHANLVGVNFQLPILRARISPVQRTGIVWGG
jgi:hypothetical protein